MALAILIVFILGYLAIALEHPLRVNKAASALITGVVMWTIFAVGAMVLVTPEMLNSHGGHAEGAVTFSSALHFVETELGHHLDEIAQILFFLIGAMTIVELVDIHGGFDVITNQIKTRNRRKLLWVICLLTFFLSAALDNLTTSIVMVSLLSKIMDDRKDRLLFAGMIVIAANAGGAWSPIGDVTTTMLWIDNKVTAGNIIIELILPSIISMVVPLAVLSMGLKGEIAPPAHTRTEESPTAPWEKRLVLAIGVLGLVMVPVYKILTHLPPYLGMMLSLGILWAVTEILNKNKRDKFKAKLSPSHALERIDTPSVLFFLGILLAVGVLQSTGQLHALADGLNHTFGENNQNLIVTIIGMLSSVVDNVPLVKGAIGMYDYPTDSTFWEYLAYCAGTGGSLLIIGSAAGVAVMGIEKIEFFWYVRKISWLALIGYFAGAGTYLLLFSH